MTEAVSLCNRQTFLTLNASSPGQGHEIGVHSQRQIMGQQLPTRRLSTMSSCPFASSVATINIQSWLTFGRILCRVCKHQQYTISHSHLQSHEFTSSARPSFASLVWLARPFQACSAQRGTLMIHFFILLTVDSYFSGGGSVLSSLLMQTIALAIPGVWEVQ